MDKEQVKKKVSDWLDLYSDEYEFITRWYTHREELDMIAYTKKEAVI